MTDAQTTAWLDQEDAHAAAMIRRHGWLIQYVGGACSYPGCDHAKEEDGPEFAYTVGLFGLGHPELLILGAGPVTSAGVLNELAGRVRGGEELVAGQLITFEEWPHQIIPEVLPNPGDFVFAANRYYQRPAESSVPVLQLSYDDKQGRFPWEPGYAAPSLQPRPGTFRP